MPERINSNGWCCSPFFFTNAVQSAAFGELGRQNQAEMMESNLEFRKHLQDIRDQYSKEKLEEQLLFRRESYELGRQYLIEQTIAQNESRREQIQFQDFINNYWPLNCAPFSVLEEQKGIMKQKSVISLNVLVAKTEATSSTRDTTMYGQFCDKLINELHNLPNITIEREPWKRPCQSRISEAMNVNYIMGGIPTLLVFPYYSGKTFGIETASWSFGRGLQSMSHSKLLQVENVSHEEVPELAFSAVKATIGMTRDAYMLAEYHAPIVFHNMFGNILSIPKAKEQIALHYTDMFKHVNSSEYIELCSKDELILILESFNSLKDQLKYD